jgi:hypothetical protein
MMLKNLIYLLFIFIVLVVVYTNHYYLNQNISVISNSLSNCELLNNPQFKVLIDNDEYPKFVPSFHNKSINFECLNRDESKKKTILMWNHFRMFVHNKYNFGYKKAFETLKCPVTNCELTNDRTKLNESSFVIFNLRNQINSFPKYRLKNQRWIHVSYESPVNCHLCYDKKFENLFNYSSTYTKVTF